MKKVKLITAFVMLVAVVYASDSTEVNVSEVDENSSELTDTLAIDSTTLNVEINAELISNDSIRYSKRDSIIVEAQKYIGSPYKYGGMNSLGFDCSGFSALVFSHFGEKLPHSSTSQSKLGEKTKKYKKGDLAFFGKKNRLGKITITHVAIVMTDSDEGLTVIHATSSSGVRIDNISQSDYWRPKLLFVVDVLK